MMDVIKQRARVSRWAAKNPEYKALYYRAHKEHYRNNSKLHAAIRQALVDEAKNKPCMDCGRTYAPFIMDLDHRPGEIKVDCVSQLVNRHARIETIEREIAKCDAVCANCHRIRTWKRKGNKC